MIAPSGLPAVAPISALCAEVKADNGRFVLNMLASLLVLAGLSLWGPTPASAQSTKPAQTANAVTPAKTPASAPKARASVRPLWKELTPMQQQSLAPLATSWDSIMSEGQKRKWLEISKNYPSLPADGRATMHSRMAEWVALSPQERAQARLNFATTKELAKQLTPEEKKAKWQSYQALSPEEKQKLAAKAAPKPAGAATAVKPVAPQKLAPVAPHPLKPSSSMTARSIVVPAPAAVKPAAPAAPNVSPASEPPAPAASQ
jgi:hypothetical protein